VLVLLPAVFGGDGGGAGQVALATIVALLKMGVLVAATFVIGGRFIPWLIEKAASTGSRELFSLTVLTVVLGIAVGSTKLFGVSMALGAFLAGMVVGRSEFSLRAASEVLPMRDAFAVLFFVSVGMLLDPRQVLASPGIVSATLAVILIGKPLAAMFIVSVLGYPPKTSLAVAVALAQIGEFSFILSSVGVQLGILDAAASQTLVAAAIVSITLNPILYRLTDAAAKWASTQPKLWKLLNARVADPTTGPRSEREEELAGRHRAIVVGFGPVGRTVTRLLKENDIEPTVIEMNLETVRRLRGEGIPAVYGDASRRETLVMAGIKVAGTLVLSSAGMHTAEEVIKLAKELNPDVHVLARSTYVREMDALHAAGAQQIFSSEGEVALSMTEVVLRELGATPDQIDRERDRVRRELIARPLRPVHAPVNKDPVVGGTH
jgi:CPA2 family monovalent cation:H+ antiporter-2